MTLKDHINDIQSGLRTGQYDSEAARSQGIIRRILEALGWPIYKMDIVKPEFALGSIRVDYALLHPSGKPKIFIEVKRSLSSPNEGEDQLFKYIFHEGVPLAVLTDGQEWHFYVPTAVGTPRERQVYKLDLLEREVEETCYRLTRYLDFNSTCSGATFEHARQDLDKKSRDAQIVATLPKAWAIITGETDQRLIDLLSEEVETLCGFEPEVEQVARFLKGVHTPQQLSQYAETREANRSKPIPASSAYSTPTQLSFGGHGMGFELRGTFYPCSKAKDVLVEVFRQLHWADQTFLERFDALPKHGQKRRYISRNVVSLYPGNPGLIHRAEELGSGWWVGTNWGKDSISKIIQRACDVAGIQYGTELRLNLE